MRELVWAAQGRRSLVVVAAQLPWMETTRDQLEHYIESGSLESTASAVLPYSPAVMAALAGETQ